MKFIYTKYIESLDLSTALSEDFLKTFENMLLQANGDIQKIFDFLETYGKQVGLTKEHSLEKLKNILFENQFIYKENNAFKITPKGRNWLHNRLFKSFFKHLKMNNEGQHTTRFTGTSNEYVSENRPFQQGDPFSSIDYKASVKNALKNSPLRFRLTYDDLEVRESLSKTNMATVLLVDISHSMILYGEDRITPAKKLALSLCELIKKKYPKDKLHVCVFGNNAWEIPLNQLDQISVGPFHTNTLEGITLAKKILKKYHAMNKQIIIVTDGKPTCIREGKEYYKNSFGLDPYIINKVLKEAINCKKQSIYISTFMLTKEPNLISFVEEFSKLNNGRSFFVDLTNLSNSVMVDFIKNRRKFYR